jgi:alkylation response protein AidB-like acyl-CoA dehydrogenase
MRISLTGRQRDVWQRFADLFEPGTLPTLWRLGDGEDEVRTLLWRTLVDLGALELSRSDEQVLLAEQLGMALHRCPWPDTVTVRQLLGSGGSTGPFALAVREDLGADPGVLAPLTARDTITGVRRMVAFAPVAEHLLVIGDTGMALVCPADALLVRQEEVSRGHYYTATFTGAPVAAWLDLPDVTASWRGALAGARLRQAAYLVGLGQSALDMAVARAKERRQFGGPIGRFQSIAFRLAALSARLDGARLLTRSVAWEADQGRPLGPAAAQALAHAVTVVRAVTAEAMQVHGAYGTTEEADVQLFFRQVAVEAVWWGTLPRLRAAARPRLQESSKD